MPLVRLFSPLSQVLIRAIGDAGGPRTDQVAAELDNIIAWDKNAVRTIHTNTTVTGNVTAGPDVLHTFSLDTPNRLLTNGDSLWVRYAGVFAGDADNKAIIIRFGGQTVSNLGQAQNPVAWCYDITYTRVSNTTVRFSSQIGWGRLRVPAGGALADEGLFTSEQGLLTVAALDANATTLDVQGGDAGSETDDIQQTLSIINLRQQ